ncbi:hypothetical protein HIM_08329 [Hirsutella minnesotensis 3608]|uniref:Ferrochelatase n=1 Tax=Hirsutella minnesotensis 3608 TaxID=1043627 RepID=A0A0F7ZT08_9HYPO|nr:hypothetical protein HIM_08329 [Hirsutella minnesotensis 3608]
MGSGPGPGPGPKEETVGPASEHNVQDDEPQRDGCMPAFGNHVADVQHSDGDASFGCDPKLTGFLSQHCLDALCVERSSCTALKGPYLITHVMFHAAFRQGQRQSCFSTQADHLQRTSWRLLVATLCAYAALLADGFGERSRAIAFSQYPQYSCGTTGSSLNELWRLRNKLEGDVGPGRCIRWNVIGRWPTHPGFVAVVANNMQKKLACCPEERRNGVTVVFSAHSQPMSAAKKGDAYSTEVATSGHAMMQRLDFSNPYRISWQSKVGFQPWLDREPWTRELVEESCLGGTVTHAASLNDGDVFVGALARIVEEHLYSGAARAQVYRL